MARYYFHLREGGRLLQDSEGCQFTDLAGARGCALTTARALLSADILEGRLSLDMDLDVEDEAGALVHRLPFTEAVELILPGARSA